MVQATPTLQNVSLKLDCISLAHPSVIFQVLSCSSASKMRSNSFTAHTVLVLPHTCPQGKVFCLSPYHLLSHSQASFKFQHIADAVYSGVDGIGIGGAQIL